MRIALVWMLVLAAGCGSTDGGATDAGALDAARDAATQPDGAADAEAPDAAPDVDAGTGSDAGNEVDGGNDAEPAADASADASSALDAASDATTASDAAACTGVEGPMPRGICDGRGMVGCRLWAEESSGRPENAYAICIQAGIGGCARADRCVDATDPSTCTCGGAEPCKEHEVCVSDTPGGARYCTCATRMP